MTNNKKQADIKLLEFNEDLLSNAKGIQNQGNTCYLNSLVQCLLSCTSVYETLNSIINKPGVSNNELLSSLYNLYEASMVSNNDITRNVIMFWRCLIQVSNKRNDHVLMRMGAQEDAHEGLMMFLDSIEHVPELRILFEHRYRTQILCTNCREYVVDRSDTNTTFDIQQDLMTEQTSEFEDIDPTYGKSMHINDFLKKQNGFVEDYKCPQCGDKQKKFKIITLTMVPEILPILTKKYQRKTITNFPIELYFVSADKRYKYIYKLIAQSEHSGNAHGGHYWAKALRSDGWYILNDSSIQQCTPSPTNETYIIFYHYFGKVEI